MRKRQSGRFGAFTKHDGNYLLSQSQTIPISELFIACDGDTLQAILMKVLPEPELQLPELYRMILRIRQKNIMIVDLLRNNLSRISLPGTVTVPNLFEVARYGDVLQTTSTVQRWIKPDVGLFDVFKAVFPCGSVVGTRGARLLLWRFRMA